MNSLGLAASLGTVASFSRTGGGLRSLGNFLRSLGSILLPPLGTAPVPAPPLLGGPHWGCLFMVWEGESVTRIGCATAGLRTDSDRPLVDLCADPSCTEDLDLGGCVTLTRNLEPESSEDQL